MAIPTSIPVHSDRHQHSGPLGIMDNRRVRSTEAAALFPVRQGRADYTFQPPPYIDTVKDDNGQIVLDSNGKPQKCTRYMVWCPSCENRLFQLRKQGEHPKWTAWRKHDDFSADATRSTKRRGYCKSCESAAASARYHRRKGRAA